MFLLLLVIFLPLFEIIGFIIIGGKIGAGLSLLWVIADVFAGSFILSTMGGSILRKARSSAENKDYAFEELFDGFGIIAGALLLIFPGFVSDALAVPLLLPFTRHWIFLFLKSKHAGIFTDLGKTSEGFTHWYYEERGPHGGAKTIEGEFRSTDDDKKLL